MSTFEGPMMAIKTVNSLSHYTDWTIGHVHAGALGWVAMISIGTLYHMIPKLWGRERMHSVGLINAHFWLATIGTVLYIASMWVNGITQGLMWRAGSSATPCRRRPAHRPAASSTSGCSAPNGGCRRPWAYRWNRRCR